MDRRQRIRLSKYLARHLRHRPERLGLRIQRGGWVDIDELLGALQRHSIEVDRAALDELIQESEKPRFSFDASGSRFRANYGHSIPLELDLAPSRPPNALFHGTAERFVDRIMREGIKPMGRRYVHLFEEHQDAWTVGRRHGRPAILRVDARTLAADGQIVYRAAPGVWLTDVIQPDYLYGLER